MIICFNVTKCLGSLVCISTMTAMKAGWAGADSLRDFWKYMIVVVSMPSAPCVAVAYYIVVCVLRRGVSFPVCREFGLDLAFFYFRIAL